MRRVVFIYARSDSSRLPGKALMPLAGRALVDIVIDRARRVGVEGCALLTSVRPVDDELAAHAQATGVQVVRGHAADLVARSLQAIRETSASHFLRVNGDSPLFAPELARHAMDHLCRADLISNVLRRRFPYGVAVEWVASAPYVALAERARSDEREHVTLHLYRRIGSLVALSLEQERDDSQLRLALDTAEDHARLSALFGASDPVTTPYWRLFGLASPTLSLRPLPRSPSSDA